MYKLLVLLSVTMVASCNSSKVSNMSVADNKLSSKEKSEGWELLFDGTTTSRWHTYGHTAVGPSWVPEDGALHLNPAIKGSEAPGDSKDIVSDDEYDNFHFKVDWKIAPNGNSGIIFFVKEDALKYKATYNTGPEMQVLDNNGHPDAKIIKHRAGDLYDLISSSKETVKPVGEWNHVEIISNKGKLDLFLNGTNIVSTTMWDENWRQMVANSKFKTMAGFGTFKKGKIALQEHGDEVWYKNIKIKKL
jgi:hypothetical protein